MSEKLLLLLSASADEVGLRKMGVTPHKRGSNDGRRDRSQDGRPCTQAKPQPMPFLGHQMSRGKGGTEWNERRGSRGSDHGGQSVMTTGYAR